MKRKVLAGILVVCMLFSILPGAAFAQTLEQLPTPTVEWLTEPSIIENKHFLAGDAVLTDIPQDILPSYTVTILNTNGTIFERYTEGFGGEPKLVDELEIGWHTEEELESGDYMIQVQYLGDGEKYSDSEVAETAVYSYIKPDAKYETPTNVKWDNGDLSISNVQNENEIFVEFKYTNGTKTSIRHCAGQWGKGTKKFLERFNELVNKYGEGEYRFRARVVSGHIAEIYHSDWSDWSDVYTVTGDNTQQPSAPTDLQWVNNKGDISWNAVDGAERYDVVVKRDGHIVRNMQCRDNEGAGVCSVSVASMINESGEYTFSVAALFDGDRSSYTQCPNVFQYVRPSQELSAPTSLQWRDGFASWAPNTETDKVLRYDVHFYKEQQHVSGHGSSGSLRSDGYVYDIMHYVDDLVNRFSEEPDAELTYSIQAISRDISTVANSPVIYSENNVKIGDYLGQLPAPKGLEWHKDRNNEKTTTLIFYPVANTYDYHVKLYCNDSLVHEGDFSERGLYTGGKIGVDLANKMTEPGVYKAEVTALGDGILTYDSDYAICTETYECGAMLAAPTNVKWFDKSKGIISWQGTADNNGYDLIVRNGDEQVGRWGHGGTAYPDSDGYYRVDVGSVINNSGDYTVLVKVLGDGTTIEDSRYVESDVFEYHRPVAELPTPDDIRWRANFASWSAVESENLKDYNIKYQKDGSTFIMFSHGKNEESELGYVSHNTNQFAAHFVEENSNQNYTFTVQANSNDLLTVANSRTSVRSEVLNESAFRGRLNTPTGITWSENSFGVLEFYPVANTKDDMGRSYHVELYRDGELILDVDHGYGYNSANGKIYMYLGQHMTEEGKYTVKLRANGNTGYSTASNYAISAPLTYTKPEQSKKGDINQDTEVNMDDVVALLNHVVKADIITDFAALAAGEVTNDTELNMDDVVKLLNYVVKAIESLD